MPEAAGNEISDRIRFPVLVIADGVDLEGFETVEAVEGAVESPDVDDVEVFDAAGRRLRLISLADPPTVGWFGITVVDVGPTRLEEAEQRSGDGPEHLRQLLIELFVRHGLIHAGAVERLTLDDALAIVRAHYMKQGRRRRGPAT